MRFGDNETDGSLIDGQYTYFAFICYTHADYREAKKLQIKLQRYGLPSKLAKASGEQKRLVPIFLDDDDMLTGLYEHVDYKALKESKYLIVICSESLRSHDKMVNEEIHKFLSYGNSFDRIIPFIIDNSPDPEINCFPAALRKIKAQENINLIGANVFSPDGKLRYKSAYLKVIAKIHNIRTTELENANNKRRRRRIFVSAVSTILILSLLFGFMTYILNTRFLSSNSLKVRFEGTKGWYETVEDAKVGDIIQLQYEFVNDRGFFSWVFYRFAESNKLRVQTDDIMIRFVLPTNMEYIEDSTILYNTSYPDGVYLRDNTAATTGINIGSYSLYGNAYVRINCRVVDNTLTYGSNKLIPWAAATVEEAVSKDSAVIMVHK